MSVGRERFALAVEGLARDADARHAGVEFLDDFIGKSVAPATLFERSLGFLVAVPHLFEMWWDEALRQAPGGKEGAGELRVAVAVVALTVVLHDELQLPSSMMFCW